MGVLNRLKDDVVNTFVSIIKGHSVTWRNLWRERVTLQYPDVRPELPPRYRGVPGVHPEVCIVCGACAKVCPVQVITMEGKRIGGTKHRELTKFHIEAGRCMFCGLCEEACPTKPVKAIRMSNVFELAAPNKAPLVLDIPRLFEIWKTKPVDVPQEQYMAGIPRKLAERDLAKQASGEVAPPRAGARAAAKAEGAAAEGKLRPAAGAREGGASAPAAEGEPAAPAAQAPPRPTTGPEGQ